MSCSLLKKLSLDCLMLALILVDFAYELTGSTIHELLGLGLLTLFLVHGGWNWQWFSSMFKGRYKGMRMVTLTVNGLLLLSAVLMMFSGIVNSDLLFRATGVASNLVSRDIHPASANWFLVLMAVHLGLHWKVVMTEAGRLVGLRGPCLLRRGVLSGLAVTIAGVGVHASLDRSLYARMIAYYSFGDWDFDESVVGFFVQYLAIVGLYASVAYHAMLFGRWLGKQPRSLCESLPLGLCKARQAERI